MFARMFFSYAWVHRVMLCFLFEKCWTCLPEINSAVLHVCKGQNELLSRPAEVDNGSNSWLSSPFKIS